MDVKVDVEGRKEGDYHLHLLKKVVRAKMLWLVEVVLVMAVPSWTTILQGWQKPAI